MIEMMAGQHASAYDRLTNVSPDGLNLLKDLFRLYSRLSLRNANQTDILAMINRYQEKFLASAK